jgi:hypothetical protein
VTIIQYFTNLDWFRFHGKNYITNQLHQEGFYEIKISRKMNLEASESFIKITGLCLSSEEGSLYGSINIYKDRIEHDESLAALKMAAVIEEQKSAYFYKGVKTKKPQYFYNKKRMLF